MNPSRISRAACQALSWRKRWPDNIRDEILGRLLELNAKRAKEEALAGAAAQKPPAPRKGSRKKKSNTAPLLE